MRLYNRDMGKVKTIYSTEHDRLCQWLVARKEERQVSLRELAEVLDWPRAIVGKIFKGDRRLDVIEYLAVCDVLGADGGPA